MRGNTGSKKLDDDSNQCDICKGKGATFQCNCGSYHHLGYCGSVTGGCEKCVRSAKTSPKCITCGEAGAEHKCVGCGQNIHNWVRQCSKLKPGTDSNMCLNCSDPPPYGEESGTTEPQTNTGKQRK